VSQYYIAAAHLGGSRNPAASNAAFKQCVRIRRVIQKSDRPYSAKSVVSNTRNEFLGNLNGAPGAIPTRDLPLRRRTLYATELREHTGSKLTDALFTCPETRPRERLFGLRREGGAVQNKPATATC
jgi:hypothetical protein